MGSLRQYDNAVSLASSFRSPCRPCRPCHPCRPLRMMNAGAVKIKWQSCEKDEDGRVSIMQIGKLRAAHNHKQNSPLRIFCPLR